MIHRRARVSAPVGVLNAAGVLSRVSGLEAVPACFCTAPPRSSKQDRRNGRDHIVSRGPIGRLGGSRSGPPFIGVAVRPCDVEVGLGRESGFGRDLFDDARRGIIRFGWRIRGPRWEEWPGDLLHRLEMVALVRPPSLDYHGSARFGGATCLTHGGDDVVREEERIEPGH
jgi:hypothetical protein